MTTDEEPRSYAVEKAWSTNHIYTRTKATEMQVRLRAMGQRSEIILTKHRLCPTTSPRNGSFCELGAGHEGACTDGEFQWTRDGEPK